MQTQAIANLVLQQKLIPPLRPESRVDSNDTAEDIIQTTAYTRAIEQSPDPPRAKSPLSLGSTAFCATQSLITTAIAPPKTEPSSALGPRPRRNHPRP